MKTAEYYVKVIVRTKADLPKDKGQYFVGRESDNKLLVFNRFIESDMEFEDSVWLRNVNWYLLPVEQIKLPSDEEIETQADLKFDNWSNKAFWLGGAKWAVDWIKDKMK